jgi:hypothetical protein
MRLLLASLGLAFAAMAVGPAGPGSTDTRRGCEPAEPVELHARIASIQEEGAFATVLVDVTLSSRIDLGAVGLHGLARRADGGSSRAFDLPARLVHRGYETTTRHALTLEAGRDQDLFITLHASPKGQTPVTMEAWIPVPLDPSRRPRSAGRVLEYRAQTGGGSEP